MRAQRFFSRSGFYLWFGAVFGVVCVLPYALALAPERLNEAAARLDWPTAAILGISVVQSALLLALMSFAGLWAGRRLGLGAPLLDALLQHKPLPYEVARVGLNAVGLGAAAALVLIAADYLVFIPANPAVFDSISQAHPAAWKGFLASFYGGIAEEVELRLFVLSFLALGLRYVANLLTTAQESTRLRLPTWSFWVANLAAAMLFGLGHLPATAALLPLSAIVVTRALVLNGVVGLVAGFLYWRRGIEMAMLCHFSADVMLHVLLPMVI